jgi:hypothetical protein
MIITQAYSMALAVQEACNLSGVVHSWSEAIRVVRAEADRIGEGTDWINQHPVNVLFANKCASLARIQGITSAALDAFGKAYGAAVEATAKDEPVAAVCS